MAYMEAKRFNVGDLVVLGKHQELHRGEEETANWCTEMNQYVGRTATITDIKDGKDLGVDRYGHRLWWAMVDIDDREFAWRLRDMKPVPVEGQQEVKDKKARKFKTGDVVKLLEMPDAEYRYYSKYYGKEAIICGNTKSKSVFLVRVNDVVVAWYKNCVEYVDKVKTKPIKLPPPGYLQFVRSYGQ